MKLIRITAIKRGNNIIPFPTWHYEWVGITHWEKDNKLIISEETFVIVKNELILN